jgi:nucleotide-binding universal stress UspA family protein
VIGTVAVGTDGSETADRAVDAALDLAERFEARIIFISAFRPVDEGRLRREARDVPKDTEHLVNPHEDVDAVLRAAEQRAEERGVPWASEAAEGEPADVLVSVAEKHGADVIVVGNKGMERRVLGSVPNSVSHKATCSVLIVKTT